MSQTGNYTVKLVDKMEPSLRLYGMRFKIDQSDKDWRFYEAISKTVAYGSMRVIIPVRNLLRTAITSKHIRSIFGI